MNLKSSVFAWFSVWRLALIALFLGLVGHIFWLQRYTFTDGDVQDLCGVNIFHTRITLKEGQRINLGRLMDGSRISGGSGGFNPGTRKTVVAAGFRNGTLTISFLFEPVRETVAIPGLEITTRTFSSVFDHVNTNVVGFRFDEQPDGSVWLAEWDEEKDGQTKKVKYGYWIE